MTIKVLRVDRGASNHVKDWEISTIQVIDQVLDFAVAVEVYDSANSAVRLLPFCCTINQDNARFIANALLKDPNAALELLIRSKQLEV